MIPSYLRRRCYENVIWDEPACREVIPPRSEGECRKQDSSVDNGYRILNGLQVDSCHVQAPMVVCVYKGIEIPSRKKSQSHKNLANQVRYLLVQTKSFRERFIRDHYPLAATTLTFIMPYKLGSQDEQDLGCIPSPFPDIGAPVFHLRGGQPEPHSHLPVSQKRSACPCAEDCRERWLTIIW